MYNAPIQYEQSRAPRPASRGFGGYGQSQSQSQYTANPDADHSVYSRSINMTEQKFVEAEAPQYVERKVIRRAEVPIMRKVKVPQGGPVVTTTSRRQRVPTKKIVQTANGFQEVTTYQEVEVPQEEVAYRQGYRVDEVEDRQLVEIEEIQRFELRPVPVGEPVLLNTRVLGRIPTAQSSQRTKGAEVFHPNHPALQELDEDSRPSSPYGAQATQSRGLDLSASDPHTTKTSFYRSKPVATRALGGYNDPHVLNNPGMQPGGHPRAQNSYDRSGYVNPALIRPAGAFFKNASYTHEPRQPGGFAPNSEIAATQWTDQHSVGITVKNTGSQHTEGHGVMVVQTLRSMPAARAGVQQGDIIRSVNGTTVDTVLEFQQMLQQFPGNLRLTLNRDGRRNVTLTVQR